MQEGRGTGVVEPAEEQALAAAFSHLGESCEEDGAQLQKDERKTIS